METSYPAADGRPANTSFDTAFSDTATADAVQADTTLTNVAASLAQVACNIRQTAIVARHLNGGDGDWARTGMDYLITAIGADIHTVKKIINRMKRRLPDSRSNRSAYERGQFVRAELREQRKSMITLTGLAAGILEDTTAPAHQVGLWFSRQLEARATALSEIAGHLTTIAAAPAGTGTAHQHERKAHAGRQAGAQAMDGY